MTRIFPASIELHLFIELSMSANKNHDLSKKNADPNKAKLNNVLELVSRCCDAEINLIDLTYTLFLVKRPERKKACYTTMPQVFNDHFQNEKLIFCC